MIVEEQIESYRAALTGSLPDGIAPGGGCDVPLTYFMVTSWADLVGAGTAELERLGAAGAPVTLVRYHLDAIRPLQLGDRVRTDVTIAGISQAPGGAFLTIDHRTVSADGGDVVADQRSVAVVHGLSAPTRNRDAVRRTELVRLGEPTATDLRLAPDLATSFALASGDLNPIHLDDDAARAAGFGGVVVHGMALLALCLACIPTDSTGGTNGPWSVSCQFGTPAHPGEDIRVQVWEATCPDGAAALGFNAATRRGVALKNGVLVPPATDGRRQGRRGT